LRQDQVIPEIEKFVDVGEYPPLRSLLQDPFVYPRTVPAIIMVVRFRRAAPAKLQGKPNKSQRPS
jgi:hypothetical protein